MVAQKHASTIFANFPEIIRSKIHLFPFSNAQTSPNLDADFRLIYCRWSWAITMAYYLVHFHFLLMQNLDVVCVYLFFRLGAIQKPRGQLRVSRWSKICHFCPHLVHKNVVDGLSKRAKLCPCGFLMTPK